MVINGESARVGLALSGGGFRAAIFHLGVLKQLLDSDLLWDLSLISSLSGGSITGAFIAQNWGDEKALEELEVYLTSKSLTANYYQGVLNPFKTRTEIMAQNLSTDLFGDAKLGDLSHGPRSYISSSNLASGNLFSFIAGGHQEALLGESNLGFQSDNAENFRIADAVAASCAFAPIFPPFRLDQDQYQSELEFITLSDGGLYDNLAVDPLLLPENCIDYAIVSDAGKPLGVEAKPAQTGVSAVWRTIDVLTEKVRVLQLERLALLHNNEQGPKPICFSIDSRNGFGDANDPLRCSAVPSELSNLNQDISLLLQRHAKHLLIHELSTQAPELLKESLNS